MSNFKSKFILQFIIDGLMLGILFTILFRVLTAVLCGRLEGTAVCLPIILCTMLANVFAAGIAVFLTQKTISKKGVTDAPQPIPFYLILAIVLIVLNLLSSVIGFSVLEGWCRNNISITVSEDLIRTAVRKSVVISDLVQAALLLCFVPFWKKRHETFF